MSTTQAIRIVGGVLPPSLVGHLQDGTLGSVESRAAKSYHLIGSESVRDGAARAWSYLRGAWSAWREADHGRVEGSAGTGPARDRWLLPLLRELGYGQLPAAAQGLTVDGIDYPVSHLWQHVPVHLLGPGVNLDKRNPGVTGAARAPQAMVQELLNRSDPHLWAILSNGTSLRLLRDSTALVGSAYIEFDLESIFEGELYAEWLLLFQLAHVSRLEGRSGEGPASCWLETWRGEATEAGARALGRLESGVERALSALGTGFLTHPANRWLVDALRTGDISRHDYHRSLLRLVYRLLFTFVAEDRDLLLDPATGPKARQRYAAYFSTARLRRLSRVRAGGPHRDLWDAQRTVLKALGTDGLTALALTPLGGVFAADPRSVVPQGAPDREDLLWGAEIANADLLSAVAQLAWIEMAGGRTQPIDYRHLGAEELGSVYEALLELDPTIDLDERTFAVVRVDGNDRKTTGSYYTSPDLVSALLDTALDPVINRAAPLGVDPEVGERALLALTVCDPACGSGGFLVAAARRIAHRLAEVRAGDDTATPEMVQHAMRDVVGQCIYGVDLNDLAAELAKVSLWVEALEPGKPLSFLDARIRTGNSLIGTTPALLGRGVPDAAFKEIEGDDKKVASEIRKRNKAEAGGQDLLFAGSVIDLSELANERRELLTNVDTIDEVEQQRVHWEKLQQSETLQQHRLQADAWCAAFVWPLNAGMPLPPTSAVVRTLAGRPEAYSETVDMVEQLAHRYRFFHWHLEFPEIFLGSGEVGDDGWASGFSCILGNPPWEQLQLNDREVFAAIGRPDIAGLQGVARKRAIEGLELDDPWARGAYLAASNRIAREKSFVTTSGRYPLAGRGKINLAALFAELSTTLTGSGAFGLILPTGIGTDLGKSHLFKSWLDSGRLRAFFAFNEQTEYFKGVTQPFALVVLDRVPGNLEVAADLMTILDLSKPGRRYILDISTIRQMSPLSGAIPLVSDESQVRILAKIYATSLTLETAPSSLNLDFVQGDLNMTSDSSLFVDNGQVEVLEGKHIWCMDYTYQDTSATGEVVRVAESTKECRNRRPKTQYRISSQSRRAFPESANSRAIFRDTTNSNNERTLILAVAPPIVLGNTLPYVMGGQRALVPLLAAWSTLTYDFVARRRISGKHLNFYLARQLPIPRSGAWDVDHLWFSKPVNAWLRSRLIELIFTSDELLDFVRDWRLGDRPFIWDEARRLEILAEIEAFFLCLHSLDLSEIEIVINDFDKVKEREFATFAEFRTRRLILRAFNSMQKAIETGTEYQTILDPPPGQGARHPAKES